MDYETLYHFIHKKMRMTHIYQPVMLKALIESDGNTLTTTQIAKKFLNEDDSQIKYYEKIVKKWPHDTLVRRHKIVQYKGKNIYSMPLDDISDSQKQRLVELCDLRLYEFIDKDPWIKKFRELDAASVSGSIRYDTLSKCKGVCVSCGRSSDMVMMDVDHIIPISLGGKTEPDNLQALCYQCNREKRNRDDLDFIKFHKKLQYRRHDCSLCRRTSFVGENELACAVKDTTDPTSHLIMPKRHVGAFVDMIPAERKLSMDLLDEIMTYIKSKTGKKKFDIVGSDCSTDGHYHISMAPHA